VREGCRRSGVLDGLRCPGVGQELMELLNGVRWDAREHIAKPGERVQFVQFTGTDKAAQNRYRLSAAVAAQERQALGVDGH